MLVKVRAWVCHSYMHGQGKIVSGNLSIDERFSFEALDYKRVREELIRRMQSEISYPLAESLVPLTDADEIRASLDETDEARRFIDRERAAPYFSQMDDLRPILLRASKGSILTIEEILATGRTTRLLRLASGTIINSEREYPLLKYLAGQIVYFPQLEEHISRCIHPEGWILDSASPELRKIRKALEEARNDIEQRLGKLIQHYGRKGYLREDNFTMRNDRYVLPFRSEHLRDEKLVIQSVSETHQTFFVEPLDMVDKNNHLQRLKGEEAAEIERILYELSVAIGDVAAEMKTSLEMGMRLDFIFAKGRLSHDWDGVAADRADDVMIRGVRHPFLKGEVVPVDIAISGRRGLIITGPNAGGKTIALKSIGLCALLKQSGLHVPAMDGTRFPIFGSVLAEIGDRQNIDLSLSSFSAHIEFLKGMVRVLERESRDMPALVLLDEIGRSTDPQEGSALALAVIEFLIDKGAFFAITTHLPALKNLTMERGRELSAASAEFDLEKVQPLYKLKLDSLGASYALLMSERFGLDSRLVKRAREIVGRGTDLLEIDIAMLQIKRDQLKTKIEGMEQELKAVDDERTKLVALERAVTTDVIQGVESAYQHASEVVEKAIKQRDSILKQTAQKSEANTELKKIEDGLMKIQRVRKLLQIPAKVEIQPEPASSSEPIQAGDRVWLIDLKKEGVVLEEGRKGQLKVAVDALKLTVEASGLRKMLETKPESKAAKTSTPFAPQVLPWLDLHGERVEEGLRKLDEYLDSAYFAKQKEVRIVHGIGSGQLRRAVRDHLKRHDVVESFRSGTPEEGGVGATIVRFKD